MLQNLHFLSSDKYMGTLRNNQSLSIIKFLYCSLVIGTGKEGPLISRKHCTCFSGNKKKKRLPATEKRIKSFPTPWKTRKLSARNKEDILDSEEHSSPWKPHKHSSGVNAFPSPALQSLLIAVTSSWCKKTLSNRGHKSKAGRRPIKENVQTSEASATHVSPL